MDGTSPATGVVRLPGWTLYLPTGAPPIQGGLQSQLIYDGSCSPEGITNEDFEFFPAEPAIDLATLFTAPFRIEPATIAGAACCGDCNGDRSIEITELISGVNHALNGCTP